MLTSPEPAATVLRALRRHAAKRNAGVGLLRLTFRYTRAAAAVWSSPLACALAFIFI